MALVTLGLALACVRSKETAPAARHPAPDASSRICAALAAPGAPADRFAPVLPLELGGAVLVFGGTTATAVTRALDSLEVRDARVAGCGPDVVAFVPGVDAVSAPRLEAFVRVNAHAATTKEQAVVEPAPRAAAGRD